MNNSRKVWRLESAARRALEELAQVVAGGDLKPGLGSGVSRAQAILAAALEDIGGIERCEHGIRLGEWCPACREDYRRARLIEEGEEP